MYKRQGQKTLGHAIKSTNNREFTTRAQNLFGEPYSAEVLKALGIKGSGK